MPSQMERLLANPRYESLLRRLNLGTCGAFAGRFTVAFPPGESSALTTAVLEGGNSEEGLPVHYKQYRYERPSFRSFGRASKALREFRSYRALAGFGIDCADPVACGEVRDRLGRVRWAFIVTRSIPDAVTLDQFVQQACASPTDAGSRVMRRTILRDLARATRRMHDGGFFHNDLHWRNVLATLEESGQPRLFWIDCPRGRFERIAPLRKRRAVKDLAALDRSAAIHCTRAERLAFVRAYLGPVATRDEVTSLARAVSRYRARRWVAGD